MVNVQQARQGKTVYGGGTHAPTRGPVSAKGVQGYMQRQVRQGNVGVWGGSSRVGGDGKSDTRSGQAKNALARRAGQMGPDNAPPGWMSPWGNGGGGGKGKDGQPKPPGPTGATGAPGPVGAAAGPSMATPTVTVNDAGQLVLPYSADWSQDVLAGLEESNASLADIQAQRQQQALDYAESQRQAGLQNIETQRGTLNNAGGSGMTFSSGHGVAVTRDANNYTNQLNQLASENTAANNQFDFDTTTIQNAFRNQLRQGSLDYGEEVAEEAGTLGYGQPGKPKAKKANRGGSGGGHSAWPQTPQGHGGGGGGGGNKPKGKNKK